MGNSYLNRSVVGVQLVGEAISLEWLHGGKIMVLHLSETHRQHFEDFYDIYEAVVQAWPADEFFLAALIVEGQESMMTPYVRHRTERVIEIGKAKKMGGHVALVLPKSVFTQLIKLFMKKVRQNEKMASQLFFSREEALAWLERTLES